MNGQPSHPHSIAGEIVPVGITRCPDGFRLGERDLSRFPVVTGADGRVSEPIVAYLIERRLWQNASQGTLLQEAYVLKDWWSWLAACGLDWQSASDEDLRKWAMEREGRVSVRRNQDCLDVLARFYRFVRTGLRLFAVGLSDDPTRRGIVTSIEPIELVSTSSRGRVVRRFRTRFRYATVPARVRGSRPTPSPEEVVRVLDELADQACSYVAARDYLCARWMSEAGLRRQGVAGLTLRSLETALAEVGWRAPAGGLNSLSGNADARRSLATHLDRIEESGRRLLFVIVTEKSKTRSAPVSFGLLSATLDFVWDQRATLLNDFRKIGKNPADGLWLSRRSGCPLSAGAISDKIKDAFNRAGVLGSGHRLRARFAQDSVRRRYLLTRARLGKAWRPEEVLIPVADELGHSGLSSLQHYLNGALRELGALDGQPVVVNDKSQVPLVEELIARLDDGENGLVNELRRLLEKHGS
ncbi:site-specific integrase [Arenibaculum pallidiluteum]|uniref:site-specific integrase n=1 Tax=Arenibaculum pallidiluteum TaxID=2812559 RepID=UPI001A95C22F|nr:site-specific integrase [Arenibaculum pallidiluteum]